MTIFCNICRSLLCLLAVTNLASAGRLSSQAGASAADSVIGARVIVTGRVSSTRARLHRASQTVYTFIEVEIISILKGDIPPDTLTVKETGGEAEGHFTTSASAPDYTPGDTFLLFLTTWPDGSLRTYEGPGGIIPLAAHNDLVEEDDEALLSRVRALIDATRRQAEQFELRYFSRVPIRSKLAGEDDGL